MTVEATCSHALWHTRTILAADQVDAIDHVPWFLILSLHIVIIELVPSSNGGNIAHGSFGLQDVLLRQRQSGALPLARVCTTRTCNRLGCWA